MHEIEAAKETLRIAGWEWVHDPHLPEHLIRHAPGSLTVGSKFSAAAWQDLPAIQQRAEEEAILTLARQAVHGLPMRAEIKIPYPSAGSAGVVPISACADLPVLGSAKIVRDPGSLYEQVLDVCVIDPAAEFPGAHQILAPAGAIWDTRTLGLYTIFPGEASRPFPRAEQAETDPETHAANVAFWHSHIFLATPQEVIGALEASVASGDPSMETKAAVTAEISRMQALIFPRKPVRRY